MEPRDRIARTGCVISAAPSELLSASVDTVRGASLQRRVAARAVVLLTLSMLTGAWAGIVLSGKVVVPIPHLALAAHLNALIGALWLLAFSFTLPMLSYGDRTKERLAWLQIIPLYGNWLITLVASVLGVRGLDFDGNVANDVVAAALLAVVVAPALIGTGAWAWGFRKP